jgi:hypothetical protein
MRKLLLIGIAVFYCVVGFAQKYHDVVYLKNRSVIKGMIIEQIPNQQLTIRSGENTFVYQLNEIERIRKELRHNLEGQQNGFYGMTEIGLGLGFGDIDVQSLKVNVIAAYRINPYFSAGIGTGIRHYAQGSYGLSRNPLLPVLGDLRLNFLQNHISPYLAFTGGYLFDMGEGFEPFGLMLNPSVGVSVQVAERLLMNFGIGYDFQTYKRPILFWSGTSSFGERTENIHAISLNVGLSF